MDIRTAITLIESVTEPTWVTRIFALADGEREEFDIDGVELSVAILGINLPDEDRPIGLRHMEVPEGLRGQGRGGAILKALMSAADRYGRPLETDVYPYEERAKSANGKAAPEAVKALVDGYTRLGFTTLRSPNYNRPVAMVYRPTMKTSSVNEKFEDPSTNPLFEMAGLRSDRTGLPFYVWVSHKAGAKHDVRIKVSPTMKYDPENTAVVGLRPTVKLIHGSMSRSSLMLLKRWVDLNITTIISFWDEDIDTEDLISAVKRL